MKILTNFIAVILGLVVGGVVNMLIINYGTILIPNPEGYLNSSSDEMLATIHLLTPKHFIMPWLAHALGTFIGAFIAFRVSIKYKFQMAVIICVTFLLGGIMMAVLIPSPIWFIVADLGLAYLPMAWLVKRILVKKNR